MISMSKKLQVCCFVLLLAGCSSPGVLVYRQVQEAPPKLGKAPVDGTYGLFIAGQSQDLYELPLKKDDPLGFVWEEDGMIHWMYAVGGASKNRLDVRQTYEWRRISGGEGEASSVDEKK
jgi:hypothetical protein